MCLKKKKKGQRKRKIITCCFNSEATRLLEQDAAHHRIENVMNK